MDAGPGLPDSSTFGSPSSGATSRRVGRPLAAWQRLDDELARRLDAGGAAPTIIEEARALAEWAQLCLRCPAEAGRKPRAAPSLSAIRQRISRRFGGAAGYRHARAAAAPRDPPFT